MAKVTVHTTMTLDGFMARQNDEIELVRAFACSTISKPETLSSNEPD